MIIFAAAPVGREEALNQIGIRFHLLRDKDGAELPRRLIATPAEKSRIAGIDQRLRGGRRQDRRFDASAL